MTIPQDLIDRLARHIAEGEALFAEVRMHQTNTSENTATEPSINGYKAPTDAELRRLAFEVIKVGRKSELSSLLAQHSAKSVTDVADHEGRIQIMNKLEAMAAA